MGRNILASTVGREVDSSLSSVSGHSILICGPDAAETACHKICPVLAQLSCLHGRVREDYLADVTRCAHELHCGHGFCHLPTAVDQERQFTRPNPLHKGLQSRSGLFGLILLQSIEAKDVEAHVRTHGWHLLFAEYVHPRQLDESATLRQAG